MAKVTRIDEVRQRYSLELDWEEAGYLKELLYVHVGGRLTMPDQPFERIFRALEEAYVESIPIRNLNEEASPEIRFPYSVLYAANDPEVDERKWWS